MALAARFQPGNLACPAEGTKAAMASVARRHQQLTMEITQLDAALDTLVNRAAPAGFLAKQGVAIQVAATLPVTTGDNPGRVRTEASFAALCGASPVDASSGKQLRHRLNRGGDRQANSALWTIAMTRLAHDPRTKAYAARRTAEGKTNKGIIGCLKRSSPARSTTPSAAPATRQCARATRSFSCGLDVGASAAIGARNCCSSLIRHACQTEPVLHDSACRINGVPSAG